MRPRLAPLVLPLLLNLGCSSDREFDNISGASASGTGGTSSSASSSAATGAGGSAGCTTVADCPGEDNQCRARACDDGVCTHTDAAPWSSCDEDGGSVCATGKCVVATVSPAPMPVSAAPSARYNHSAVWTGSEMLVWGGLGPDGGVTKVSGSGARYDPDTNTWTPISMDGAPEPRHSHVAVWTGSEMLVWGGFGQSDFINSGGRYDPATDTWEPMSTTGAPGGRTRSAAVWAGAELLVWGGLRQTNPLSDGGRYVPETDTWSALTGGPAPNRRFSAASVWTGTRFVVWGGTDTFEWLASGAIYDPGTGAWLTSTSTSGAPPFRESPTSVWTGEAMVIWGGWNGGPYLRDGARLHPDDEGGTWVGMTTDGAPTERRSHVSVWTGSELFVWGGCGDQACMTEYADGGRWMYGSAGDGWLPVGDLGLTARVGHTAVWADVGVIIWGGRSGSTARNDGAMVAW